MHSLLDENGLNEWKDLMFLMEPASLSKIVPFSFSNLELKTSEHINA